MKKVQFAIVWDKSKGEFPKAEAKDFADGVYIKKHNEISIVVFDIAVEQDFKIETLLQKVFQLGMAVEKNS
jgi:hypothetical protein